MFICVDYRNKVLIKVYAAGYSFLKGEKNVLKLKKEQYVASISFLVRTCINSSLGLLPN